MDNWFPIAATFIGLFGCGCLICFIRCFCDGVNNDVDNNDFV